MASKNGNGKKQPPSAAVNLIAGGGAGMMEALACHPLGKIQSQTQKISQPRKVINM
ncbi:hypothetical protein FOXG_02391 [Fusarium oxysporum f. sp. lycopersici 4287]|uniref:Uncharacterized protein n=1 Tax=Fusarium oxysporum f. sp. lycopersici (strain 4287 / CBS 123668 / FGSC 9935 / NRRL 34936) TaxID=426428 RepID=A0A0J9UET8_FUSO4|nr:hypothetical protein FOXG_02391 [Fusarium oxysporum f. sp. lycopersici 4287]KNA97908.1 hypothetical protein FOXG_02391 [Fusarium oxysporum f. sp. lycopersici 4287]